MFKHIGYLNLVLGFIRLNLKIKWILVRKFTRFQVIKKSMSSTFWKGLVHISCILTGHRMQSLVV
ncbi:hypothetical protein HanIR_Chr01g0016551 [Helianthus annuus]|nr:hypothetical protein HanIR_Chr01g0016551 [Helianthus annuus]